MEQIKKSKDNHIKVVWICHFSNQRLRAMLPLSKQKTEKALRKLFNSKKNIDYVDFAPWVTNLILEFEKMKNVELHVIAPHRGLKRLSCEFEMNGVHYHIFKPDSFHLIKTALKLFFNYRERAFRLNRFLIRKFIKSIKPDIINIIGTENPYYSIAALDISGIPVYISVQTVYTNPARTLFCNSFSQVIWDIELLIHKKNKYYGCSGRMHRDLIIENNPNAIIFKNFFPVERPGKAADVSHEYDFVFYSVGVSEKKGVEDAIMAFSLVKKTNPHTTLNIVGHCGSAYKNYLIKKIYELGIQENVVFNEYFPIHADLHNHLKKARFALLPVKLDVIPGSIIEAMLLELPVVTYKTSGTPYLNKNLQTVLLADIGDINTLAKNMHTLLNDQNLANELKKNAKSFAEAEFENKKSAERLLNNYHAVLGHYHHSTPIPKELLLDTNEFPLYTSTKVSSL